MYQFSAWQASDADPTGGVKVFVGDTEVGQSDATVRSAWQDYDLYEVGVAQLTAGQTVIRVEFPDGGLNFAALEIVPYVEPAPETEAPTEAPPAAEETPADEAGAEDGETPAPTTAAPANNDDGGNTMVIIIIVVVAVIAIGVVVAIVMKKKK
jgi:uncharacterized protein HemX